ncbi:hypothetical protein [Sutcliffiella rhizosphaerae]|uniref:hypothetical protein n=1 Tax=Sutcliffiella rhizosphaerae TaxID=2880967 RepID=UPI001E523611|nr:hypothetical protein [Sutcliffiella rhizosphaerae]
MNKILRLGWLVALVFSLTACSRDIPDTLLHLDYLDDRALEAPETELTYSEIDGEYVHDFIKSNKDKAVRWTATVSRIENDSTFELKEPLLPSILVTFSEELNQPLEVGDIVTFKGLLIGYGETFGKDPLWVVRPAHLEETTADELDELIEYQEKAKEKVRDESR